MTASKQLITLLTGVFFILNQLVIPAQGLAVVEAISVSTESIQSSSQITIPAEFGTLEESHQGTNGKTIIYIQDAHDSLEAQEHIAKLIHHLVDKQDVRTVFTEGYEGSMPNDEYFGFIEDPKLKERVSYFFMDQLRIGGAEFAHINRSTDFDLIGADSINLHLQNIRWYQESAKRSQKIEQDLIAIEKHIKKLANKYFPKELKQWLKWKKRLDENQIELLDYLKRIEKLNTIEGGVDKDFPNLVILLQSEKDKDPAKRNLKDIDAKSLFREIELFEQRLADAYLESERDQRIFDYYRGLGYLKRLNRIEITFEEYESIRDTLNQLKTRDVAEFILKYTDQSFVLNKSWEDNIRHAVKFYEIAEERDKVVSSTVAQFRDDIGVLVFGGFHKENIRTILRGQGYSYAIITPRITSISERHQKYYRQLMQMRPDQLDFPGLISTAARQGVVQEIVKVTPKLKPRLQSLIGLVLAAALNVNPNSNLRQSAGELILQLRGYDGNSQLTSIPVFRSEVRSIDLLKSQAVAGFEGSKDVVHTYKITPKSVRSVKGKPGLQPMDLGVESIGMSDDGNMKPEKLMPIGIFCGPCTSMIIYHTKTKQTLYAHSLGIDLYNLHSLLEESKEVFAAELNKGDIVIYFGGASYGLKLTADWSPTARLWDIQSELDARQKLLEEASATGYRVITAFSQILSLTVATFFDPEKGILQIEVEEDEEQRGHFGHGMKVDEFIQALESRSRSEVRNIDRRAFLRLTSQLTSLMFGDYSQLLSVDLSPDFKKFEPLIQFIAGDENPGELETKKTLDSVDALLQDSGVTSLIDFMNKPDKNEKDWRAFDYLQGKLLQVPIVHKEVVRIRDKASAEQQRIKEIVDDFEKGDRDGELVQTIQLSTKMDINDRHGYHQAIAKGEYPQSTRLTKSLKRSRATKEPGTAAAALSEGLLNLFQSEKPSPAETRESEETRVKLQYVRKLLARDFSKETPENQKKILIVALKAREQRYAQVLKLVPELTEKLGAMAEVFAKLRGGSFPIGAVSAGGTKSQTGQTGAGNLDQEERMRFIQGRKNAEGQQSEQIDTSYLDRWNDDGGAIGPARSEVRFTAIADKHTFIEESYNYNSIGQALSSTADNPGSLFVHYDEINKPLLKLSERGAEPDPSKFSYEKLAALSIRTRAEEKTHIVVYGFESQTQLAGDIWDGLRDAGIKTIQGGLNKAYLHFGYKPQSLKDATIHNVHFSMYSERLKKQIQDNMYRFKSNGADEPIALLFARSGGKMEGVDDNDDGIYSVVGELLKTQLQEYYTSLVVAIAA